MKNMIHSSMQLSAVLVYAAQSLGLFLAFMFGMFAGFMVVRNITKRSLERTGE